MYPAAFEYHAPTSVKEALGLLGKLKDDAKLLAGGHSLIALGAEMVCEGAKGRRTVKVDDWFKGLMTTAVGEDEILVEIRVPVLPASSGAAYLKFPHPASRFAVVGVAAAVTLDGRGMCSKASVGVTGAGTKAVRAKGVEAGCTGKKLDAAAVEAAAPNAVEGA